MVNDKASLQSQPVQTVGVETDPVTGNDWTFLSQSHHRYPVNDGHSVYVTITVRTQWSCCGLSLNDGHIRHVNRLLSRS